MDRPGGYEPSNARSTRAGDAVAVADLAMQRTVTPHYMGSNPISHPASLYCWLNDKFCRTRYYISKKTTKGKKHHEDCNACFIEFIRSVSVPSA